MNSIIITASNTDFGDGCIHSQGIKQHLKSSVRNCIMIMTQIERLDWIHCQIVAYAHHVIVVIASTRQVNIQW